jgi:6-phosphofructokinase 1
LTGKTRIRLVDLDAEHYGVAREYMVRLESSDFEDRAGVERRRRGRQTADEFQRPFADCPYEGRRCAA